MVCVLSGPPSPPPKEMMHESLHLMVHSQKSHSLAPNQLKNSVRLAALQNKIIFAVVITYFIKTSSIKLIIESLVMLD